MRRSSRPRSRQGRSPVSAAARTLGRLGGIKGGPARAHKLSRIQRSNIARLGGKARQGKH